MPRLVDHELRRRQITDAVRRLIVRGGLDVVTFQSVAAEAGFSVSLVQYYCGTKKDLLLATHRSVMENVGTRFAQRRAEIGEDLTPREAIRAVLTELLPLDDQRQEETIVLGVFGTASVTGQGITPEETLTASRLLVSILADQLERAPRLEPSVTRIDLVAELIAAAIAGISQGIIQGHGTPDQALELVDQQLDLILGKQR
ncbi:TetR family transcriptional regulator [Nocardia neocaledoniensis]|uniref:TetR family transcriptional regulator n=1 Tax=Nocardia neocaledoniensis TaxID=236511 RepID=A0A317NKX7_9NOCA|nr:TetR family transcriptional regulator [Nocardia neocaledoniensis]